MSASWRRFRLRGGVASVTTYEVQCLRSAPTRDKTLDWDYEGEQPTGGESGMSCCRFMPDMHIRQG
jgi:hypothetical protein